LLVRLLQNTPPFNLFVALDVQRHASAEFDELVNQHKQLVEQRDAARSDAEKASALVKTAKVTLEAMANTTKAKGKTKADIFTYNTAWVCRHLHAMGYKSTIIERHGKIWRIKK
jgi:hypothetical protein